MITLRILSYNIHKGKSPFLLNESLSAIRDSIRDVNADIVFLQEICGAQNAASDEDSRVTSQLEFLADEVWPHYSYGKNAVYDSGALYWPFTGPLYWSTPDIFNYLK